ARGAVRAPSARRGIARGRPRTSRRRSGRSSEPFGVQYRGWGIIRFPINRYVYDFDEPAEGGRDLLGGKGIGLAEMTQLGVPVPAGFTITTNTSPAHMASGGVLPDGL